MLSKNRKWCHGLKVAYIWRKGLNNKADDKNSQKFPSMQRVTCHVFWLCWWGGIICCIILSLFRTSEMIIHRAGNVLITLFIKVIYCKNVLSHFWWTSLYLLKRCKREIAIEVQKWLKIWAATWDLQQCWYVRPAKPQISLCIHAVWSEPLLVALIFYECQATDWTSFGVLKLKRGCTGASEYTCQNATLLEILCGGSKFCHLHIFKCTSD